jgi:hypothetical protein
VVWNHDLAEGLGASQDHVASLLPPYLEAELPQGLGALAAREARQLCHTATSTA